MNGHRNIFTSCKTSTKSDNPWPSNSDLINSRWTPYATSLSHLGFSKEAYLYHSTRCGYPHLDRWWRYVPKTLLEKRPSSDGILFPVPTVMLAIVLGPSLKCLLTKFQPNRMIGGRVIATDLFHPLGPLCAKGF